MKKRLRGFLIIPSVTLGLGLGLAWGASYDSSFLGSAPAKKVSPSPVPKAAPAKANDKARRIQDSAPKDLANASLQTLSNTITSLTTLMPSFPPGPRRHQLILNRAMASSLYARKRLLDSKALVLDTTGKRFIESAIRDAEYVLNAKDSTPELRTKARRALGFAYVYQDRLDLARQTFEILLREDPKSDNAGSMALVVAEGYFDHNQFTQALDYYQRFEWALSKESLELSRYKQAWCWINLNRIDKAEEIFSNLIKTGSRSGAAKDSMRDLAYLLSHSKDPTRAIRMAPTLFRNPADEITFLGYVRGGLESQDLPAFHRIIAHRLLQLEKDPERRLELLLANLRVSKKPFAAKEHHDAMLPVRDHLLTSKIGPNSAAFRNVSAMLEFEMQTLMRLFIECFAGRAKSPEFPKAQDSRRYLMEQFEFFNAYFPDSRARPQVTRIWLDICMDSKDWACSDRVIKTILDEPKRLAAMRDTALRYRIIGIEEQLRAKPTPELKERMIESLKVGYLERDRITGWLQIAKNYADLLLKEKKFSDAVPVLLDIYSKEKTVPIFYSLQMARYQTGAAEDVLKEPVNEAFEKKEPGLREIRREASLALAIQAREKKDLKIYRKHIADFLALQPPPEKALIAKADYFQFLMDNNLWNDLSTELIALPSHERLIKNFSDAVARAWQWNMYNAQPEQAERLLTPIPPTLPSRKELLYQQTLAGAMRGKFPREALPQLAEERQDYLLGTFALLQPRAVIDHFSAKAAASKRKGPLPPGHDRELTHLALRIHTGKWALDRSPEADRLMGIQPVPPTPRLEKELMALTAPTKAPGAKNLGAVIARLADQARRIRTALPKELTGKPPEMQLRLASLAISLEKKIAGLIVDSPVPAGLSPEDTEKYKVGLKGAAEEFDQASAEYAKIASAIQQGQAETLKKAAERLLPVPPMGDWPWPDVYESDPLEPVLRAVEGKRYLEALLLLDLLRPENIKEEHDYYAIRAGILISSNSSEAMRMYLLDELEKTNQKELLEKWREFAKKE